MSRIAGIDQIRGLAILAVVLLHINIVLHFDQTNIGQHFPIALNKVLWWSGYYAVMVFFVVSGFLITSGALQRWGSLQAIPIQAFYRLRFARIMPCLLAVVAILITLKAFHIQGYVFQPQQPSVWCVAFSALSFHINWLEAQYGYFPGTWGVLWSLSVEECFYVFFPLICRLSINQRGFIVVMIGFIILGPLARIVLSHNDIWQDHSYLSCMDGIAFGCLAAWWAHSKALKRWQTHSIASLGLLLLFFIVLCRKTVFHLGLTHSGLNVSLLEAGMSLLLIALYQQSTLQKPFVRHRFNPLINLGRNSYEIYLSHMFVVIPLTAMFLRWHAPNSLMLAWYLVIVIASGLLGEFIARIYSNPLNYWLRH